jgi:tRNA-dihydrouridine synthase
MNNGLNIYLAPFQGVTLHTFRRIYARHFKGVTRFYTPFFAKIDTDVKISDRKEKELQHIDIPGTVVVPQILSKDAAEILRFARICQSRGFNELNWNLGCPHPQVADKKRGSGMLPFPDMVDSILNDVFSRIEIRFSVKCRLGYENPNEILKLVPVFNRYPVSEITLHGRTGRQLYGGIADKTKVAEVAALLNSPVVHNGDIMNVSDYVAAKSLIPDVDRWMIGRGILCDPFLPERLLKFTTQTSELRGLTTSQRGMYSQKDMRSACMLESENTAEYRKSLQRFLDDLYFGYRRDMNDRLSILNILKEYWDYLADWFPHPDAVLRHIKKTKTFDEYEDGVKRIFDL